jgi:hypothetical protein
MVESEFEAELRAAQARAVLRTAIENASAENRRRQQLESAAAVSQASRNETTLANTLHDTSATNASVQESHEHQDDNLTNSSNSTIATDSTPNTEPESTTNELTLPGDSAQ